MKIYLVEHEDCSGYDVHSGFVCFANSEEEARYTSPDEYYEWQDGAWAFCYADGTFRRDGRRGDWPEDPSVLKVTELGTANDIVVAHKPLSKQILASFHAG